MGVGIATRVGTVVGVGDGTGVGAAVAVGVAEGTGVRVDTNVAAGVAAGFCVPVAVGMGLSPEHATIITANATNGRMAGHRYLYNVFTAEAPKYFMFP